MSDDFFKELKDGGFLEMRICVCNDKESGHADRVGPCERCSCQKFVLPTTEFQFPDDNLAEMKAEVFRCENSGSSLPLDEMIASVSPVDLKILIARIEEAEEEIHCSHERINNLLEIIDELRNKAAGK